MIGSVWRFRLAVLAFVFWMGYLAYLSLPTLYRPVPVVSRARWMAATTPVIATVSAGPDGRPGEDVTPVRTFGGTDLASLPKPMHLANLADATGFTGSGDYLLLLTSDHASGYRLVAVPRSPGLDAQHAREIKGFSPTVIYSAVPAVVAQAEALAAGPP